MGLVRLMGGRGPIFGFVIVAAVSLPWSGAGLAAGPFPFDQEMLLDVAPMPPVKRVPVMTVTADGEATIDLWCKTVAARVTLTGAAIRIEPGPLPEGLPRYMSDGQCTPERMDADLATLTALIQVTGWRRQGQTVVLTGPTTLKFRPSDH